MAQSHTLPLPQFANTLVCLLGLLLPLALESRTNSDRTSYELRSDIVRSTFELPFRHTTTPFKSLILKDSPTVVPAELTQNSPRILPQPSQKPPIANQDPTQNQAGFFLP
jgi:hypothetical protein